VLRHSLRHDSYYCRRNCHYCFRTRLPFRIGPRTSYWCQNRACYCCCCCCNRRKRVGWDTMTMTMMIGHGNAHESENDYDGP